jgi:hypothetical protein
MTSEQQVSEWVDVIATHNQGDDGLWTARFVIDDVMALQRAVTSIEAVNAKLTPNGPSHEYAVHFQANGVRDVVGILAGLGARLSPQQRLARLA